MLCSALIALALFAPRPVADPAGELRKLETLWKAQAGDVKSARLKFRHFRTGDLAALTPGQVEAAFAGADLTDEKALTAFLNGLLPGGGGKAKPWADRLYWQAGDRAREANADDISSDILHDGASILHVANAGKQADVCDPAKFHVGRIDLKQFRPTPAGAKFVSVRRATGGDLVLTTAGGYVTVVDPATGLLRRSGMSFGGEARLVLTQKSVKQPGGVTLQTVVAKFDFSAGSLKRAEVTVVEEADFNVDIPDAVFRLAMPAGSVIVDNRGPKEWTFRTPIDLPDVAGYVRAKNPNP